MRMMEPHEMSIFTLRPYYIAKDSRGHVAARTVRVRSFLFCHVSFFLADSTVVYKIGNEDVNFIMIMLASQCRFILISNPSRS